IIMGMRAVGVLSEYLLGSVTTSLILRTKSPVMIVPEHSEFIRPKNITFACDYNLNPDVDVLMPLKKFVELFNSKIMILNFLKQDHTISSKKAKIGILMENYLKDIAHTYYFEEEKDFIDGIIHFTGKHDTDLIALVPHHHSWIHNLIKGSHTKRLAFHTTIPLLTIPERDQN
ncbi:MAG: universal stress protein, partial [Bacteroidetes bacterium]|nr:universal stress protein [Bacteroidota bacterium]